MLRTDHQYPPTRRMPLGPPECRDSDMGELALTLPAPLPPQIEELRPSQPEVTFMDDEAEALYRMTTEARARVMEARATAQRMVDSAPDVLAIIDRAKRRNEIRVPWLACVVSAALFALGYWLGRLLP